MSDQTIEAVNGAPAQGSLTSNGLVHR